MLARTCGLGAFGTFNLGTLEVGRDFQIVVALDRSELSRTLSAEIAIAASAVAMTTFTGTALTMSTGRTIAMCTLAPRSPP